MIGAAIAANRTGRQNPYLRHCLGVNGGNLKIKNLQPLGSERDKDGGKIPVNAALVQDSDPDEHE